jgi:hypothetical protein
MPSLLPPSPQVILPLLPTLVHYCFHENEVEQLLDDYLPRYMSDWQDLITLSKQPEVEPFDDAFQTLCTSAYQYSVKLASALLDPYLFLCIP